jgi:cysteine-rich repeat protein
MCLRCRKENGLEEFTENGERKCREICGDGILVKKDSDKCDDGNNNNGDGCSSDCQVETNSVCTRTLLADRENYKKPEKCGP